MYIKELCTVLCVAFVATSCGGSSGGSSASPVAPTTVPVSDDKSEDSTDPPETPTPETPAPGSERILDDLRIFVDGETTLTVGATTTLQLEARYTDGTLSLIHISEPTRPY